MLVCVKGFEEISSDELVKINGGSSGPGGGFGNLIAPPGMIPGPNNVGADKAGEQIANGIKWTIKVTEAYLNVTSWFKS